MRGCGTSPLQTLNKRTKIIALKDMMKEQTYIEKIAIPQLSHLQFAVLDVLGTDVGSGKELRKRLSERGIKKSGPSFYQMMARLEEAKFVEGSYKQEIIEGQIIKERQYRIVADGVRALNRTKQYYTASASSSLSKKMFRSSSRFAPKKAF